MKLLAEDVKTQNWQEAGPNANPRQLTNIIARFYTSSSRRIVIAAHYGGGRPTGGSNQSAQDAGDASGAAILLELARSFEDSPVPPGVGIDLVFFDSEPGANGRREPLGARYFAEHLGDLYGDQKPIVAIVLDSLCRSNLQILKPQPSVEIPAAQEAALWSIGQKLNPRAFLDRSGPEVPGDQTALTAAGIPAVLVTDSEFPNSSSGWAMTSHCSAQSLGMIGQTLLTYITRPAKAFDRNEVVP
jgi:Zn-dependent M28 family amino/carboxypeptidase